MKRTLLFAIAALLTVVSFSQEKKPVTHSPAPKSDTVYVDLSKAKVIVLLDSANSKQPLKMLSAPVLANSDAVYANKQFWYRLYIFMKGSRNGDFSQADIEGLQQPFAGFAADWEKMLQQMQSQQAKQ